MSVAGEILVVDDTPANLDVLRTMLENEGFAVATALSGDVALRIAPKIRPALILLDVMMPGLDGFETCARLKASDNTRDIPIIFVTARTDTDDVLQGFRAGAVDYISKPFRREEVLARVRTHVLLCDLHAQLRHEADRFRAIVNNISDALLMFDQSGRVRFANPAAIHLFGRDELQLVSADITLLLTEMYAQEYRQLFSGELNHCFGIREVEARRADSVVFPLDFSISPVLLGEPFFVGICRDISQRKDAESALVKQASTDALTGLANRRAFEEQLLRECGRARRAQEPLTVAMIDIDHFKPYNDYYGHPQGDRCLLAIGQVLQQSLERTTDFAARYGGEEFVMLLPNTPSSGAEQVYQRFAKGLHLRNIPHERSPLTNRVTASVGMYTVSAEQLVSPTQLLKNADMALYQAKANGRNCARFMG